MIDSRAVSRYEIPNKSIVIHDRQKVLEKKKNKEQQSIQRFFNATASADLSVI